MGAFKFTIFGIILLIFVQYVSEELNKLSRSYQIIAESLESEKKALLCAEKMAIYDNIVKAFKKIKTRGTNDKLYRDRLLDCSPQFKSPSGIVYEFFLYEQKKTDLPAYLPQTIVALKKF